MAHRLRARHVLVTVLALLAHGAAPATASGEAELASAVAADVAGDEAYIELDTVEAFSPSGGAAVFAPGTEWAESFEYQAVDAASRRLMGLVRTGALEHPAGTLVVPLAGDQTAPDETPSGEAAADGETGGDPASASPSEPTAAPSRQTGATADQGGPGSVASSPSMSTSASATPPTCELLFSQSCATVIGEVCNEGIVCDVVQNPGNYCEGIVCEILQDPLGLCAEGIVCDILHDPLGLCAEGIVCEILGDPTRVCDDDNVACDAVQDPLGPWSVCDVEGTGEECPDPDDLIDLVWGTSLGGLTCTASVSGPEISHDGGFVGGRGRFDCGEFVGVITIEVCLHRSTGGAWLKMGCREKAKGRDASGGVWGAINQRISEPCGKGTTQKYRIRARGWANDGGGPDIYAEGRDSAKETATLFCPGISVQGAPGDAGDYADSWVPTND